MSKTVKKRTTKKTNKINQFGSKLSDDVGTEIERRYCEGESINQIAKALDVTVGTVRYRFLDYLIKKTYTFTDE